MTIIAYKDGVMAADGLSTQGSLIVGRQAKKIVRAGDGSLAAAAGVVDVIQRFQGWFRSGYTHDFSRGMNVKSLGFDMEGSKEPDDFAALVAAADGALYFVFHIGNVARLDVEFVALGNAEYLATGAMLAGASAERAVQICCENNVYCGGDIQVEHLHPEVASLAGDTQHFNAGGFDTSASSGNDAGLNGLAPWREANGLA